MSHKARFKPERSWVDQSWAHICWKTWLMHDGEILYDELLELPHAFTWRKSKRQSHSEISELRNLVLYSTIKQFDWMLQVMWWVLTNQSTLFLSRVVTILWNIIARFNSNRHSKVMITLFRVHFQVWRIRRASLRATWHEQLYQNFFATSVANLIKVLRS